VALPTHANAKRKEEGAEGREEKESRVRSRMPDL
jgi:hypothetical protein